MDQRRLIIAPALLVTVVLLVAACTGGSGPTLTDPHEILTRAVSAVQKTTAVHLKSTIDGTLSADLTRSGKAVDLSLAGTTLDGDLNFAANEAHVTAAIPALLGLTADVIVLGTDMYARASLSGDKYRKSTVSGTDPVNPTAIMKMVTDFLARPEIKPVKKDDAPCGSASCYQIEGSLSATDLATMVGPSVTGLLPVDTLTDATVTTTLLVDKDTLLPAAITMAMKGTRIGDLTLKLTLTNWDKAVTISAPPPDQVQ